MIAAHRYVKEHTDDFYDLDADQAKFEREEAFTGCELVHDTHRLALMNAMLHDIDGQILLADTLVQPGQGSHDFDLVLTIRHSAPRRAASAPPEMTSPSPLATSS